MGGFKPEKFLARQSRNTKAIIASRELGDVMKKYLLMICAILWADTTLLAIAQPISSEQLFRIETDLVPETEAFKRDENYVAISVLDSNIYRRKSNRDGIWTWLSNATKQNAVENIHIIIGDENSDYRFLGSSPFLELYSDLDQDKRKRLRTSDAQFSAGRLEILGPTPIRSGYTPPATLAFYGVIQEGSTANGFITAAEGLLSFVGLEKIGGLVDVVSNAADVFHSISKAVYEDGAQGREFAVAHYDNAYDEGAILSSPGVWILSKDLKDYDRSNLDVAQVDGFYRLYYKADEDKPARRVDDATFALIEVRARETRVGTDQYSDWRELTSVAERYDAVKQSLAQALEQDVTVDTVREHAFAFRAWMESEAQRELTTDDIYTLAYRVYTEAELAACQSTSLQLIQVCADDAPTELTDAESARIANLTIEQKEAELSQIESRLETLAAQDRFLSSVRLLENQLSTGALDLGTGDLPVQLSPGALQRLQQQSIGEPG